MPLWLIVASLVTVAGCARVEEGQAGYRAAFGTPAGVPEKNLVEKAGVPSRVIQPATAGCIESGGQRELVYELSSRWVWGGGRNLESQVVVCIGAEDKVIHARHVEF